MKPFENAIKVLRRKIRIKEFSHEEREQIAEEITKIRKFVHKFQGGILFEEDLPENLREIVLELAGYNSNVGELFDNSTDDITQSGMRDALISREILNLKYLVEELTKRLDRVEFELGVISEQTVRKKPGRPLTEDGLRKRKDDVVATVQGILYGDLKSRKFKDKLASGVNPYLISSPCFWAWEAFDRNPHNEEVAWNEYLDSCRTKGIKNVKFRERFTKARKDWKTHSNFSFEK